MWSTGGCKHGRRLVLWAVLACHARLALVDRVGLLCPSWAAVSARDASGGWDELTGLTEYIPHCLLCLLVMELSHLLPCCRLGLMLTISPVLVLHSSHPLIE